MNTLIDISFDDGTEFDSNVLDMIYDAGLTQYTTFFLPTKSWGFENIKKYINLDVEIGGHTVNHPQDLKLLSLDELKYEIEQNKHDIEDKLHREVTKFCFPRGRHNGLVRAVASNAGYTYMRTTKVLETKDNIGALKNTTLHFYNREEYDGKDWLDMANEILDTEPEVFRCWGHSKEIFEKDGSFIKLGKLLKRLSVYCNT